MKVIYLLIDNGHGIDTFGKRSLPIYLDGYNGIILYEWEVTRKIAKKIVEICKNIPEIIPILITPEDKDISLNERVRRINSYVKKYGAKNCVMISLHTNASGMGKEWMKGNGWECYTTRGQNNSDKLAECLYDVAKELGFKLRTDTSDGDKDKEAGYQIIKGSNCPAVLSENLFHDNLNDAKYLLSEEGQKQLAILHINGVKKYFNI